MDFTFKRGVHAFSYTHSRTLIIDPKTKFDDKKKKLSLEFVFNYLFARIILPLYIDLMLR